MSCSNRLLNPSQGDHVVTKTHASSQYCVPARDFAPLPYAVRGWYSSSQLPPNQLNDLAPLQGVGSARRLTIRGACCALARAGH